MITRKRYSREFKETLVMEIISGQSTAAKISKREGISVVTLSKWKQEISSGTFRDKNKEELSLRKRISELEGAVADLALQNHILKKTEKYLQEYKRKERLSGSISLKNLE
ncbi:MAG: transposase [Leptospiraceae bacterium]|jgi:transposase-like protein|nr:transposase [Leptospiraceae bacterium]